MHPIRTVRSNQGSLMVLFLQVLLDTIAMETKDSFAAILVLQNEAFKLDLALSLKLPLFLVGMFPSSHKVVETVDDGDGCDKL